MKCLVEDVIHSEDIATLEHAKIHVDAVSKTVSVDSWLMPEEFIVAFVDEDYDVRILEA